MTHLVIDNYDSFTYNLVHFLGELGADLVVRRNDRITVDEVMAFDPESVVLSPGPCSPNEAGICLDLVSSVADTIPVFGVCLGHQTIGQVFGGEVVRAPTLMHGKLSEIVNTGRGVVRSSIACGAMPPAWSCSISRIVPRSILNRTTASVSRPCTLRRVCSATWPWTGSAT